MIKLLRIVGYLEGTSYILLLFVAVPIKHYADDPQLVKLLGMPHGLLFISYIIITIINSRSFKWGRNKTFQIMISSIVPFGTYYIDKKYF